MNDVNKYETCPICLETSDPNIISNQLIKIEHCQCRYYIHSQCLKLYEKCVYCKKTVNSNNSNNLNILNNLFCDHILDYLSNMIFLIMKYNNIGLLLFFILSFILTYCLIIPKLIFLVLMKDYSLSKSSANIFLCIIIIIYLSFSAFIVRNCI